MRFWLGLSKHSLQKQSSQPFTHHWLWAWRQAKGTPRTPAGDKTRTDLKIAWSLNVLPAAAAAAKSLQSWPTLCDPRDSIPAGSPGPGILQARTLEWVAISFSNAGKWKVKVKSLSRVRFLAIPWTAPYQTPPSMGFSRQECWSGLPFSSPMHESEKWKWSHWVLSDS